MKKFFYGCLIVFSIFFIAVQLIGCDIANIKSLASSQISVEIPDGWIKLKEDDFSIYLPDGWEGGSAQELASIINTQLQTTPTETNPDNKSLLVFYAYDSKSTSEYVSTNLNVLRAKSELIALKDYVNKSYQNISVVSEKTGYKFEIEDQKIQKMGSYSQVARTITLQELFGSNIKMAQYIIKDNNAYWVLTFSAAQKDFDDYIDTFDKAIQTSAFE